MKKLSFLIVLVATLSFTFTGCNGQSGTGEGNSTDETTTTTETTNESSLPTGDDISVEQLKLALADEGIEISVLDVRTPDEWSGGVIQGTEQIDFLGEGFAEKVESLDKNKTWAVYCAVGGRSSKAATLMREKGFTKVYNVTGGYNAWKAAGN